MMVSDAQDVIGSAPVALYRLYGADGTLLWVGITGSLSERFAQHAASKPWWPDVARKTVAWCQDRSDAARAEAAAIRDEHPLYNVRLQPRPKAPKPARPMTGAERVQAHRVRQREKMAGLEEANECLRERIADLEAELAEVQAGAARSGVSSCRHPSEVIQDGRCGSCGEWL